MNRSLPHYNGLGFSDQPESQDFASYAFVKVDANPGLLFDKFIDTWAMKDGEFREQKPDGERNASAPAKAGGKRTFLDESAKRGCNNAGLADYHNRRNQLLEMLKGEPIPFQTDWRFVSGLGSGHPYETGFIWHRTLGVPYLPGSSVKGLIRAWAEQWNSDTWKEFEYLFGDTDGAGALIVFDAIPTEVPTLEVDIMNPHYSEYYQGPQNIPPADYLSPKPIFFLAVAEGAKFNFALAPRRPDNKPDVAKGIELLTKALEYLGAGAKTAVGYGHMTTTSNTQPATHRPHPLSIAEAPVEILWENAALKYDPGRRQMVATHADGKQKSQLDEAQTVFDTLTNGQKRKAKDGSLRLTVRVLKHSGQYSLIGPATVQG